MQTGGDKIEGEIDTILDKVVMLFSYLSDKVPLPSLLFACLRESMSVEGQTRVCCFLGKAVGGMSRALGEGVTGEEGCCRTCLRSSTGSSWRSGCC